jgi:hypothetical protein
MTAPEEERGKWRGLDGDKAMRKALGTGDEGASPLLVSLKSLAELWDLDRRKAKEATWKSSEREWRMRVSRKAPSACIRTP